MSKSTPSELVQLKLSELVIDTTLSGRTEKEIKENAKALAPEMEAFGSWDAMQPGQYFLGEDGKPTLCAGFTRVVAAQLLGYKTGYFFRDESDPITRRLKCITTNGGKPVSRHEQGRVYSSLNVGVIADDFAGAVADPSKASDWKTQPMEVSDIAAKIGKTAQHVRDCIVIFESPEEVGAMIEAGQVSSNIVVTARQWAKDDDGKMVKILKAAVREAGDEKATRKHMDAIKSQFVKQKAVSAAQAEGKADTAETTETTAGEAPSDERAASGEKAAPDYEPELELKLPASEPPAIKPPTKKETKTIRESSKVVILKWAEETDNALGDAEVDQLIDALTEAGLLASHLPF